MNERGYSLLEVMISMVVLAIAFLALIATQVATLGGYVAARDEQQATELARRTAELLNIQGLQWVAGDVTGDPGDEMVEFNPDELFSTTEVAPFDVVDPIGRLLAAEGDWVALVDTPVDVRLMREDAIADYIGGKHCIFVRGEFMAPTFTNEAGLPVRSSIRVQIAVVYPGPRQTLERCDGLETADLNNVGGMGDPPQLEVDGYRVTFSGTILTRRAHLTNPAAVTGIP